MAEESVMIAEWTSADTGLIDQVLESRFERLQETIVAVRNVRALYRISPKEPLRLFMRCTPEVAEQMQSVAAQFDNLARTMLEATGLDITPPVGCASFTLNDADGFIPLEGLVDRTAELDRMQKESVKLRGFISGHEKKLGNAGFVSKAPEHVVTEIRETLANLNAQLESVERKIQELGGT
jgi:valyl-tRNA synthetase